MKALIKDDFSNLIEFRNWCKSQPISKEDIQIYSDAYTEQRFKEGDFGVDANLQEIKLGITSYNRMDLIEALEAEIEQGISGSSANDIPKRKLAYNDLGLGVFSFDRAAQGMYRLHEFYSPKHQKVFEPEMVSSSGQNHVLKADNSPITKRWEEKENGQPKVRTNNKKVFAYFPKVKRQRAAVEIYVSCGNYANISARDFLYSGMVAVIIAKKLIAASIPVKINTVIGWANEKNVYCAAVIPLKEYGEPLDVNLLALATSDPRFWRYEGFKACTKIQHHFKQSTGGAGLTGADLKKVLEQNQYRMEVPNRFYFGRVQNRMEALKEISNAIEQISNSITK